MNKILPPLLVIIFLATSGMAYYFHRQVSLLSQTPQAASAQEVSDVVAKVGKLIRLPEGETPTLATVADPSKLKDQAFFAKAKQGDKVLLFSNAKIAYLYDPVANKILEVAPINLGNQNAPAPAPTTPKPDTTSTTTPAKK